MENVGNSRNIMSANRQKFQKELILDSSDCIGRGGYGSVYNGYYDGSEVAIKVCKIDDNYGLIHVLELDIMSRLRQRNLMPCLKFRLINNKEIAYIMPLAKYDLQVYYEKIHAHARKKRNWYMIFQHMYKLASAINFLHENNIIHLDIKPSNILVDANDDLLLTDFGLSSFARWAGQSYKKHGNCQNLRVCFARLCGTAKYMPPECLAGTHSRTDRSDIWSLGLTYLFMMTGKSFYQSKEYWHEICENYSKIQNIRAVIRDLLQPHAAQIQKYVCYEQLLLFFYRMFDIDPLERPSSQQVCDFLANIIKIPASVMVMRQPINTDKKVKAVNYEFMNARSYIKIQVFHTKILLSMLNVAYHYNVSVECIFLIIDLYMRLLPYISFDDYLECKAYMVIAYFIANKLIHNKSISIDSLPEMFGHNIKSYNFIQLELHALEILQGIIYRYNLYTSALDLASLYVAFSLATNLSTYCITGSKKMGYVVKETLLFNEFYPQTQLWDTIHKITIPSNKDDMYVAELVMQSY